MHGQGLLGYTINHSKLRDRAQEKLIFHSYHLPTEEFGKEQFHNSQEYLALSINFLQFQFAMRESARAIT